MNEPDMSDTDHKSNEGLLNGKRNDLNNGKPALCDYTTQYEVFRLRRYLYALGGIVLVGNVIFIIVVAVLFGKLSYDIGHHSHQPKVGETIAKILEKEELCIPCNNLRLGPSEEEDRMLNEFTRKHEPAPAGEQCCVETPKQLLAMLELFVEKRYREEMARGKVIIPPDTDSESVKQSPAAHFMGSVSRLDQPSVPGSQFAIYSWIYDADLAFMHDVTYRHGRIVVPSNGLYFVYSQVSFLEMLTHGSTKQNSPNSLSHYIYRYNIIYPHGGEEKLIQNSITKNIGPNTQFGEYSSYLGALFHLRRGDEIFVKVSNLTLIVREPKLNYFGLFKLPSS